MPFGEAQQILCGRCKVPIGVSDSSSWEPTVTCPICGQSGTLEEARREAGQHAAHRLLSRMLDVLDRPELSFRFIEGSEESIGRRSHG
jgi:hypothetical protein